jgi:hypothetical protein
MEVKFLEIFEGAMDFNGSLVHSTEGSNFEEMEN